eukprot:CAMPEP_0176199306 /NCGR_PEP_ID=MMETSP0121_2-20121125/8491_1 /TAXON_ID=160619 /ORGANISM="Kryptoperidinium foliaceum, Strain CCMP 1326" /LENGTH=417 /DNA_ID=CAMNT_0017538165 /DNA_START=362 /DNA_END=1612 /DNA_ORIENTATION=+
MSPNLTGTSLSLELKGGDKLALLPALEDGLESSTRRRLEIRIPLRLDEAGEGCPAQLRLPALRDMPPDHVRRRVHDAAAEDLRRLPDLEAQAVPGRGHRHLLAASSLDEEPGARLGLRGAAALLLEPHGGDEAGDRRVVVVPAAPVLDAVLLAHAVVVQQPRHHEPGLGERPVVEGGGVPRPGLRDEPVHLPHQRLRDLVREAAEPLEGVLQLRNLRWPHVLPGYGEALRQSRVAQRGIVVQRVRVEAALREVRPALELLLAAAPPDAVEGLLALVLFERLLRQQRQAAREREQRLPRLREAGHAPHVEDSKAPGAERLPDLGGQVAPVQQLAVSNTTTSGCCLACAAAQRLFGSGAPAILADGKGRHSLPSRARAHSLLALSMPPPAAVRDGVQAGAAPPAPPEGQAHLAHRGCRH